MTIWYKTEDTSSDSGTQFLNAVLSSIAADVPPPSLSKNTPKPTAYSAVRPNIKSATPTLKRKAVDDLQEQNIKVLKDNTTNGGQGGRSTVATAQLAKPQKPTLATSPSALSVPYRGTIKAGLNTASSLITPVSDPPKSAPKRGSYAEIMARATAAAQVVKPVVGVIKHRPKDALSIKKEILLHKKGLKKNRSPDSKDAPRRAPNGFVGTSGAKSNTEARPRKKTVSPPAYRGTAAPKPQPSYKGTMKPVASSMGLPAGQKASAAALPRSRSTSMGLPSGSADRRNRYLSEDEEDEELDEEGYDEEEDLGGSSDDDMEADFLDVEEEESVAAKAARKEDEEQARIELQMKRDKEERRKRLEQLAKSAKQRSY